mgnify:CR=1 FL=1
MATKFPTANISKSAKKVNTQQPYIFKIKRMKSMATGGIGDFFVLLPRILWCEVPFARAFPPREARK